MLKRLGMVDSGGRSVAAQGTYDRPVRNAEGFQQSDGAALEAPSLSLPGTGMGAILAFRRFRRQ
jgi:hypothetical protein